MKRAMSIVLATGAAIALGACSSDSTEPPDDGGNGGGGGDVVEIRMQNTAFVAPSGGDDVTVTVGTRVQWVNLDGVQHTATSTSVPQGGAAFDSGLLGNGDRFEFTPQVAGTWVYFCEVHPGIMVGATLTATAAVSNASSGNPPSSPNDPEGPGYK
jgi:plastocyanin